jgi:hypothetical protein
VDILKRGVFQVVGCIPSTAVYRATVSKQGLLVNMIELVAFAQKGRGNFKLTAFLLRAIIFIYFVCGKTRHFYRKRERA